MNVALCQINTTIGDFAGNADKVLSNYDRAVAQGADLVLFPELVTCGYPPRDLLDRPGFVEREAAALAGIVAKMTGAPAILGALGLGDSEYGKRLRNRAVVIEDGRVSAVWDKVLLPNYDVFDEARYFEPGTNSEPIRIGKWLVGVTVCEDIWNDAQEEGRREYIADPVAGFEGEGLDLLVNISASPWRMNKERTRLELLESVAKRVAAPVAYCNLVGGADELVFDGRSMVVSSDGALCLQARAFEEDLVVSAVHQRTPIAEGTERSMEDLYHALRLGVRDYVSKCGFSKAIFGLSGGIDSAVVAVIAADALGQENVRALAMPSQYSSAGSLSDAAKLANHLGMRLDEVPIREVFDASVRALSPLFEDYEVDATEENMQARTRGVYLMALSNKTGALLLTTGNKSELAVGYCTLYGDMCGALAVISDVPKTQVYALARWMNRDREVVPETIISKAPSAELRPDQTDQDSLPAYETLDEILYRYVERCETIDQIIHSGIDANSVRQVVRLIEINEYKRRQAAPGLRVTSKAFGMGRRIPVARSILYEI